MTENGTLSDSDLEVAVESLYVGMILSVSVDIEPSVATGSRKDVGSRINAAALCPSNHPNETVPHNQSWNLHRMIEYTIASRQSLAASSSAITDATTALVGFATVGASAFAFIDMISAILTLDGTHDDLPKLRSQVRTRSDISLGRTLP